MHPEDTILLIVATTGEGEIPSNGQQFMNRLVDPEVVLSPLRFSIFGIGDSGYHQTFNAAAKSVHHIFEERKLTPLLLNCVVESDVAVENPPWTDFRAWWDRAEKALGGEVEDGSIGLAKKERISTLYEQQYNILQAYKKATMDFDLVDHRSGGILKLSLGIPEPRYEVMGHIRLLPRNSEAMVDRAMELLGINGHQVIGTVSQQNSENPFSPGQMLNETQVHLPPVPISQFLASFVDLRSPFLSMDWALDLSNIKNKSVLQVLEYLSPVLTHLAPSLSPEKLLLSMAPLRPRCYSIASSSVNKSIPGTSLQKSTMDILVRIIPDGRFSHHCLSELGRGSKILHKLTLNNICLPLLNLNGKPLVAVACGTGIAPVRSLIQHLIYPKTESKMSLSIGFKPNNSSAKLFVEMVEEASKKGVLDMSYVVPSNEAMTRVQDYFEDCREVLRRKMGEKGGYFYVCGGLEVVKE